MINYYNAREINNRENRCSYIENKCASKQKKAGSGKRILLAFGLVGALGASYFGQQISDFVSNEIRTMKSDIYNFSNTYQLFLNPPWNSNEDGSP